MQNPNAKFKTFNFTVMDLGWVEITAQLTVLDVSKMVNKLLMGKVDLAHPKGTDFVSRSVHKTTFQIPTAFDVCKVKMSMSRTGISTIRIL